MLPGNSEISNDRIGRKTMQKQLRKIGVGVGLGLCLVSSSLFTAPAQAQLGSNLSDVTGTNVFNSQGSGFGGISSSTFAFILQGLIDNLNALLEEEEQSGLPGSVQVASVGNVPVMTAAGVKQSGAGDLSPETRQAVQNFRDDMNQLVEAKKPFRSDDAKKLFDANIKEVSKNLAKDVESAEATCNSQGGEACGRVTRLTTRTNGLLGALDTLQVELDAAVQSGRAF